MSRHVQLRISQPGSCTPGVLYAEIFPKTDSPRRITAFVGGLPRGDIAFRYMTQTEDRSDRDFLVVKFNRFVTPDPVLEMLQSVGLKISARDRAILDSYVAGNREVILSPTTYADETATFLQEVALAGGFSGIPLMVIGHSIGASTIALRLRQLEDLRLRRDDSFMGVWITLFAPMILHPDIQEKAETGSAYALEFSRVREQALFAGVSGNSVVELGREFSRFWTEQTPIQYEHIKSSQSFHINVVIADTDEESSVRSKVEFVRKLNELGVPTQLFLLSINGEASASSVRGSLSDNPIHEVSVPPAVLDDARKVVGANIPIHELYPFLLSWIGHTELI